MRFLTKEWLDFRSQKLMGVRRADPGIDLSIQHVVTDGPDGVVRYHDQIRDGSLVNTGWGTIEEPDFVLTRRWSVDLGLLRGELDPYTALVDGHVQVTGDEVRMLALLPLLQDYSAELEGVAHEIAEATDD